MLRSLSSARFLAPLALLLVQAGCGGGGSTPTAPAAPAFQMSSAAVVVDGVTVNGATVSPHHGGGPTRFEARLQIGGQAATGGAVYCRYELPNGGGMMQHQGLFTMYDDGTHGDAAPGDGLYCYQDQAEREQYGCHDNAAGPGEYQYEFWGQHHAYGETEHHRVTVTVR
jgi:hypothetical protein